MLQDARQRLSDSAFLLWISSPELSRDFEFLEQFLKTDCTNVDFIPKFLSPDWIPSFYRSTSIPPQKPFASLYRPTHPISLELFTRILGDRYSIPSFFAKPVMARIDPKILKRGSVAIKFSDFLCLASVLDHGSRESKLFGLLAAEPDRDFILLGDLAPFIIQYLKDRSEFESVIGNIPVCAQFARFIITRLFLVYDPQRRGKITWRSFQRVDFLATLKSVARFDQFHVAYQQFLTLDKEHNNGISLREFENYDSNRIHPKVIARIWQLLPGDKTGDFLSFADFAMFLVMLEDKSSAASLNFWFAVCDLDEDGVLSLSEMRQLYHWQKQQLKRLSFEPEKFKRLLPQVLDMIGSADGSVARSDLEVSGHWPTLFNFLIDSKRFSEWEFTDPLYGAKGPQRESTGTTPWDLFCEEQLEGI
jgi:serine/threonine-protein phosphatase 2A regulatory subunit B''